MAFPSQREDLLRLFDARARDFTDHCRAASESGAATAEADLSGLWALAQAVSDALRLWRPQVDALDLARRSPLAITRAACLIAESVFDETLTPLAYGAFRVALESLVEAE
jgi:hypothetical protein